MMRAARHDDRAADLQSLAARIQPYHVGVGCDLFVTVPWTEWQAVLEQAHQALTLEERNRNLQPLRLLRLQQAE